MRSVQHLILLTLLLAHASACASEVGQGSITLGSGESAFEPLADEQEVPLIRGVQGGYHVWLSVETVGIGRRVSFETITQPLDESLPEEASRVSVFMSAMAGADEWVIVGYPGVLSRPECVLGKPLRILVTLEDEEGDRATDERVVVPTGDPSELDLPPCD